MRTSDRTLFYLLGYIMGGLTVPGLICRLYWGNWGAAHGAAWAFGVGLFFSVIILAALQEE